MKVKGIRGLMIDYSIPNSYCIYKRVRPGGEGNQRSIPTLHFTSHSDGTKIKVEMDKHINIHIMMRLCMEASNSPTSEHWTYGVCDKKGRKIGMSKAI